MNFREYQIQALRTEQKPAIECPEPVVPLLGLAGEAGELLSEYKKYLRDGESHRLFKERVSEELGDLLWYIADAASKFGLDLEDVAQANLDKCRDRWGETQTGGNTISFCAHVFDAGFPEYERIPRQFEVEMTTVEEDGAIKMRAFVGDKQLGQDLTDNAYSNDGYRFHDVFHLACAAVLGWSPIVRRNLGLKRKSSPKVDEVEDGGRAGVIEEGVSALVFNYAVAHAHLQGITSLDYTLLKTIKDTTSHLEVSVCSLAEWEYMIFMAYRVWRQVEQHGGGTVALDLDARTIEYKAAPKM